jgi:hypothetical protein
MSKGGEVDQFRRGQNRRKERLTATLSIARCHSRLSCKDIVNKPSVSVAQAQDKRKPAPKYDY